MSPELLDACTGCGGSRAQMYAQPLADAMAEFGITTDKRVAAFLAQVAHESGLFKWMKEIWGPTEAQRLYEGRHDLGNTQEGDGFRYRGRGMIQITGRANYRDVGMALGVDFEGYPDMLSSPVNAARSAAWFWHEHGCDALADAGLFEGVTRRINGGLNGYPERCVLWKRAKLALGVR